MGIFNKIREFIFGKLFRIDKWLAHNKQFINDFDKYENIVKYLDVTNRLGFFHPSAGLHVPDVITCPEKVYLYEHTSIYSHAKFIISSKGTDGKFIMKKNSCSAWGLTVITGNHGRAIGKWFNDVVEERSEDIDKDVIVEEDVWIGANVTILSGVKVGRGATVGAGAVIKNNIPPYSIVTGNPAKVVGFSFKPEEIIEHEKVLYPEEERLSLEKLEKNYNRYFLNRLVEIRNFTSL